MWVKELPPFWEGTANSACSLCCLWLFNSNCLLRTWCGIWMCQFLGSLNIYFWTSGITLWTKNTDLVLKFNVGLKSLLQQDLLELEVNGDLVYKFRKKVYISNDFSTQFRNFILRYIKIGYTLNVIRQTACMVVNTITVNNVASRFGY